MAPRTSLMIPGWDNHLPEPQERTVDEVRQVLATPECPCSGPLYYMYRDLSRDDRDRHWLARKHLRYDITVIPPLTLCGEYVKTKGHYHPDAPSGTGYPELYEILSGDAHHLLQDRSLSDAVLIRASAGDKVVVPPGYGHVTINPSPATLIMANLVASSFSSSYGLYEELHGAAYYEMLGGELIRNPYYPEHIPLRQIATLEHAALGVVRGISIYELVEQQEDLSFLTHPERYIMMFRDILAD
ncbi:MAG: glucose-6-phosphate isomerase [Methanomicrobiales archaeon]|nr:glucose-6-phosphate isomerase [Methanomicrobiales archaeon]